MLCSYLRAGNNNNTADCLASCVCEAQHGEMAVCIGGSKQGSLSLMDDTLLPSNISNMLLGGIRTNLINNKDQLRMGG
jgi:hypothetical protein